MKLLRAVLRLAWALIVAVGNFFRLVAMKMALPLLSAAAALEKKASSLEKRAEEVEREIDQQHLRDRKPQV